MAKLKKKKQRAPDPVVKTTIMEQTIDYKQKYLDDFMKQNKNERMYLSAIGGQFYIKVRILEAGNKDAYENVLVKVLEKPVWLPNVLGDFLHWKGVKRSWKTAVRGTKMFVSKLCLSNAEGAMKRLHKDLEERRQNLMVAKVHMQCAKDSIVIYEDIEKRLLEDLSKEA